MTSPVCRPLGLAAASARARAAAIVVTWTPLPASHVRVSIIELPPRLEPIMPPRPAGRAAPGAVEGTVYEVGRPAVGQAPAVRAVVGLAAALPGTEVDCHVLDAAYAADPTRSRLAVTSTVQASQRGVRPVELGPLIACPHHGRTPALHAAAGTSRGRSRHARSDGPGSPRESPGPAATDPDAPDGQA